MSSGQTAASSRQKHRYVLQYYDQNKDKTVVAQKWCPKIKTSRNALARITHTYKIEPAEFAVHKHNICLQPQASLSSWSLSPPRRAESVFDACSSGSGMEEACRSDFQRFHDVNLRSRGPLDGQWLTMT